MADDKPVDIPRELPKVLVTERAGAPDNKAVLETKAGIDDVQVVSSRPWVRALIRAGRTWLQGVAANIVTAGTAVAAVQAMGFPLPSNMLLATMVAIVVEPVRTAAVTFIQNMLELTAHLDKSNPKLRG